jgi:hypothetical protein
MMKLQEDDWNHPPRGEKRRSGPTANIVGGTRGLWAVRGSPDSYPDIPQAGHPRLGRVIPRYGVGILPGGAREGGGHEAREAARTRCRFAARAGVGRWRAREVLGTPKRLQALARPRGSRGLAAFRGGFGGKSGDNPRALSDARFDMQNAAGQLHTLLNQH